MMGMDIKPEKLYKHWQMLSISLIIISIIHIFPTRTYIIMIISGIAVIIANIVQHYNENQARIENYYVEWNIGWKKEDD